MIKRGIIGIVLNGASLYLTAYALEDVSYEGGWKFLLIGALIMGILNTVLKPLLKIVTLPFIFFTAGFFLIVINSGLILLTKYILDVLDFSGIKFIIQGWQNYLAAGLVFGIVNWVEHLFFNRK